MAQAAAIVRGARRRVIAELKAAIAEHGLTARDLGLSVGAPHKTSKATSKLAAAPNYRGRHGELWSGRGRMPVRLSSAVEAGEVKDSFLFEISSGPAPGQPLWRDRETHAPAITVR